MLENLVNDSGLHVEDMRNLAPAVIIARQSIDRARAMRPTTRRRNRRKGAGK